MWGDSGSLFVLYIADADSRGRACRVRDSLFGVGNESVSGGSMTRTRVLRPDEPLPLGTGATQSRVCVSRFGSVSRNPSW